MEQSFLVRLEALSKESLSTPEICHKLSDEFPDLNYDCIRSRVRRFLANNTSSSKQFNVVSEEVRPQTTSVEYRKDGTVRISALYI